MAAGAVSDLAGPLAVGLPLGALLAFGFSLGVWGVFIGRAAEEVAKTIYFGRRIGRLRAAIAPPEPAAAAEAP